MPYDDPRPPPDRDNVRGGNPDGPSWAYGFVLSFLMCVGAVMIMAAVMMVQGCPRWPIDARPLACPLVCSIITCEAAS